MQSTGTFFAAARLSGATPPPAHVLSRSIGLQVKFQSSHLLNNYSFTLQNLDILVTFVIQGISMLIEGICGSIVGTTASV